MTGLLYSESTEASDAVVLQQSRQEITDEESVNQRMSTDFSEIDTDVEKS